MSETRRLAAILAVDVVRLRRLPRVLALIAGRRHPPRQPPGRNDRRLWMIIPLSLICQLRGVRTATLALFDDEAGTGGAWSPVPIDIDTLAGAKPLLNEACPPGRSTRR